MMKLSDEVSVRGEDLVNKAIFDLIPAEVSKPNPNKHSNSEPWALEYTGPSDEGKSATFILNTGYGTAKKVFPQESKQKKKKKKKRQKVQGRGTAAAAATGALAHAAS